MPVPLTADGRHDLPAMAAAVTERTRVVLVCTPNNPTGPAVTAHRAATPSWRRARPTWWSSSTRRTSSSCASADPVDGVATALAHPNVIVTRTFSKAYGLAGFRVGYAVAQPPLAAALRAVSLPFGVSHVAQAAAIASLAAEDALLERVEALVGERTRVLEGVRAAGWESGGRRATSSGSRRRPGARASPRRPRSWGSRSGPSPATGSA